jgi:predicted 3-demethylubiquinone-9 3-methyltransferase (glyoxalase superfamily)
MPKGNRKLNPKGAKAMTMSLKGHNHVAIAKSLGLKADNKASASAQVSRLLKNVKESEGFTALMDKLGVTNEAIIRPIKEALKAKETKFAIFEGKFTDKKIVIDHSTRMRASELAGKWKGLDKSAAPEEKPITLMVTLTTEKKQ